MDTVRQLIQNTRRQNRLSSTQTQVLVSKGGGARDSKTRKRGRRPQHLILGTVYLCAPSFESV